MGLIVQLNKTEFFPDDASSSIEHITINNIIVSPKNIYKFLAVTIDYKVLKDHVQNTPLEYLGKSFSFVLKDYECNEALNQSVVGIFKPLTASKLVSAKANVMEGVEIDEKGVSVYITYSCS